MHSLCRLIRLGTDSWEYDSCKGKSVYVWVCVREREREIYTRSSSEIGEKREGGRNGFIALQQGSKKINQIETLHFLYKHRHVCGIV